MPATTSRIAFITQQYRSAVAGPDSGVATKYGNLARDTKDTPVESFFESEADAGLMATERLNLLKADRRYFKPTVVDAATGLGLDYSQVTPTATYIDDERQFNAAVAIVAVQVDLGSERTMLEVWG